MLLQKQGHIGICADLPSRPAECPDSIITVLAPLIVDLMTGSLVVEKIFAIPGVGSLLVTAIQSNDYNVVIALSFIYPLCISALCWWWIFCMESLIRESV